MSERCSLWLFMHARMLVFEDPCTVCVVLLKKHITKESETRLLCTARYSSLSRHKELFEDLNTFPKVLVGTSTLDHRRWIWKDSLASSRLMFGEHSLPECAANVPEKHRAFYRKACMHGCRRVSLRACPSVCLPACLPAIEARILLLHLR